MFVRKSLKIIFILAFLPVLREFSVVSLYLFEEIYASLELPIHPEYNAFEVCKLKYP